MNTPRTVHDILAHADELAQRFEDYDSSPDDERDAATCTALRDAVLSRSSAERTVVAAVADAWAELLEHRDRRRQKSPTLRSVLRVLAVEGYRSLRHLVLPLTPLTVVTGANGTGKSSLYRVLRLLAATAQGGAVAALAAEGGLESLLWAGPERVGRSVREDRHPVQGTLRTAPVSLRMGFAGDDFGYAIDIGQPQVRPDTMFVKDPQIKAEAVWAGPVLRPATLLTDRRGSAVLWRGERGAWTDSGRSLRATDSVLAEVADPVAAPEVLAVREQVRSWRFYDSFRTDVDAPARGSRPGTWTPVVADDGGDLASALQTLRELEPGTLESAVDRAFPGSRVDVVDTGGRFTVHLHQRGLLRPLSAAELSDGTLRYLLWTAALLTPRPPALFVLNEPETSLHPDLIAPLAALVTRAAQRTQTVVVTHSAPLRSELARAGGDAGQVELVKEFGETAVVGRESLDEPAWHWPRRGSGHA